jgi:hypothetical protein
MLLDNTILKNIRDAFQDSNINFLVGSGASMPYLKTLNNIEKLLEILDKDDDGSDKYLIARVSIYKRFYDVVIDKNIDVLVDDPAASSVIQSYRTWLETINYLMLRRKSTLLDKQVNLFTTNVDLFFEKSLDGSDLEYNDGFGGRFNPKFNLSNFKKTQHKKSLQYDNKSEIPIFNLMKLHGSLTWALDDESNIRFSHKLEQVKKLREIKLNVKNLVKVDDDTKYDALIAAAHKLGRADTSLADFRTEYEKLSIINPDKNKFKQSLLNENYYELLRLYTNELEKENTLQFVFGFSFADEHIRHVTMRTANANPTLVIYIFAHSNKAALEIEQNIKLSDAKNNNIKIITPPLDKPDDIKSDKFKYDLNTFCEKVFSDLLTEDDKIITLKIKGSELSETKN